MSRQGLELWRNEQLNGGDWIFSNFLQLGRGSEVVGSVEADVVEV